MMHDDHDNLFLAMGSKSPELKRILQKKSGTHKGICIPPVTALRLLHNKIQLGAWLLLGFTKTKFHLVTLCNVATSKSNVLNDSIRSWMRCSQTA